MFFWSYFTLLYGSYITPSYNCIRGPSWKTTDPKKILVLANVVAAFRAVAPNNLQSSQDETHYLHRQDGGPNLGAQAATLAQRSMAVAPIFHVETVLGEGCLGCFF